MIDTDEKISPILEYLQTLGYKYETVNGKRIINTFSTPEEELNSLYKGVGLRDISGYGIIELSGKDVLDFLHRISTNSLKELPQETIGKTIFTNEKGRVIDTSIVMNFGEHQILICSEEYKHKVAGWISKYIIMDDVKMNIPRNKYALLELMGPQADSFITLVCGNVVNEIEENKFKSLRAEGIIFFLLKMRGETGSLKYWILADQENGLSLVKYMINNKGPFNFNLVGSNAFDSYRVDMGIPAAPNEINDEYNPHETGMLNLVNFAKGCYIGQEVIARLDTYNKVQKHLKKIEFTEPVEPNGSYELFDGEGNQAGKITTTAYSIKEKQHVGLAYIRKDYLREGTELTARKAAESDKSSNGKNVKVIVKDIPFNK